MLAYRVTLNVLLLAVLKRLFDIAQRQGEGRDLRHVRDRLSGPNLATQKEGVADLLRFALRGRANALAELERVGDARNGFGPEIRFEAAESLRDYGYQRGVNAPIYVAIAVYRGLLEGECARDKRPSEWATLQNSLGAAFSMLGERESGTARLEEAVAAYHEALKEWTREAHARGHGIAQANLTRALALMEQRRGSGGQG